MDFVLLVSGLLSILYSVYAVHGWNQMESEIGSART